MSYNSTAAMYTDDDLIKRITACAAEQQKGASGDGAQRYENWVNIHLWDIVNAPGWSAKYDQARANGNKSAGNDTSVISDGDILAVVQPMP